METIPAASVCSRVAVWSVPDSTMEQRFGSLFGRRPLHLISTGGGTSSNGIKMESHGQQVGTGMDMPVAASRTELTSDAL